MNKRMLLLFGILLVIANACSVPGTEVQTTKIPGIAAPEITASEITPPQITTSKIPTKEGLYENDVFSFNVPERWGLTFSQGEHFDLGVEKIITIHNKSLSKKSVSFFTIASAALSDGETLESRFNQAYKKGPELENAVITPFEKNSMTGIELTYGRP